MQPKKTDFPPITDFRLGYLLSLADSSAVEPGGIPGHIVKELIQNVLFWREEAINHHSWLNQSEQCETDNCAIERNKADQVASFKDAPCGVFEEEAEDK